jgi:hypothetical protein
MLFAKTQRMERINKTIFPGTSSGPHQGVILFANAHKKYYGIPVAHRVREFSRGRTMMTLREPIPEICQDSRDVEAYWVAQVLYITGRCIQFAPDYYTTMQSLHTHGIMLTTYGRSADAEARAMQMAAPDNAHLIGSAGREATREDLSERLSSDQPCVLAITVRDGSKILAVAYRETLPGVICVYMPRRGNLTLAMMHALDPAFSMYALTLQGA